MSKRKLLALYLVSIAASVGILAAGASAEGQCGSNQGCSWAQTDFGGLRKEYKTVTEYQFMGDRNRSVKNRFNTLSMIIRAVNGDRLSCVNPGNNDRNTYLRSYFVDNEPSC